MPESDLEPLDAGPAATTTEDLEALIRGTSAPEAGTKPSGTESEDDLMDLIKGVADNDAGEVGAKPKPKPGQETEDDLMDLIKGN